MHKTVIALAIAGLAAAPAFADSNVTLYGSIDYGFGVRSGDSGLGPSNPNSNAAAARPKQEFISGTDVFNRLGFKGAEDLGNGTKAIFELEIGYLADTGENSLPTNGLTQAGSSQGLSSGIFRNHSFVGLTGNWGTLIGGRVDGARYSVSEKYDPFNGGSVGSPLSLNGQASRADNAIAYVTPNVEGLYAVFAYVTSLIGQEAPGNTGDIRDLVIQGNYSNGPVAVTLNYERLPIHNDPNNTKIYVYTVGASYDFGVAKLMGAWDRAKTDSDAGTPRSGVLSNATTWWIGGQVPVTDQDKLRLVYSSFTDHTPARDSCRKWGVGGEHFMSKRTNLYLDFASLNQLDKGACTIYFNSYQSSGDAGTGSNTGGVGTRGVDAGIVHRF